MTFIRNNGFRRGEVDETLYDTADPEIYESAARRLLNWFPDQTGAISRRPSFEQIHTIDALAEDEFMLEFEFRGQRRLLLFFINSTALEVYWIDAEVSVGLNILKVIDPTTTTIGALGERLGTVISYAQFGPSMFFASELFQPFRVFFDLDTPGDLLAEDMVFFEEIFGVVTATNGSSSWVGTDTIFTSQLEVGDNILFQGNLFEIATVVDDENFTTTTIYDGLTATDVLAVERAEADTPFFEDPPRHVGTSQGRLLYATNQAKPTGVWASAPNRPFVLFGFGVNDDSPINVELIDDGLDEIQWLTSTDRLYLGSRHGEYSIGSPDAPLTPATFGVRRVGSLGNARRRPVTYGANIYHMPVAATQVFFTQFDELLQGFRTEDLTVLSEHLLLGTVEQLLFQPTAAQDRTPRLYAVMADGTLASCALAQANGVIAWAPFELGGPHSPSVMATGKRDTYVLARSVDDADRIFILRLAKTQLPYHMDYAEEPPQTGTVITAGRQFRGHEATIYSSELGVLGIFDVPADGVVDLADFGTEAELGDIVVGFFAPSILEMLEGQYQTRGGSSLSRKRRLIRAIASVRNTSQLMLNNLALLGNTGSTVGSQILPQDGKFEKRFLGWSNSDTLRIEGADVYPATIISLVREYSS